MITKTGPHGVRVSASSTSIARHIQLIGSWSFIIFGVTMVLFSTVRANGAVYAPLITLVVSMFVGRIGFAAILLPRYGTDVLWWSFPVGSVISLSLAILYYRFGRWRQAGMINRLVKEEAVQQSQAGGRLNPNG